MKKHLTIIFMFIININFAQINFEKNESSKWINGWTNFIPNLTRYQEPDAIIPNTISENLTLTNDQVYLLSGNVYVTNNAELKIEPGTLIRCDYKKPGSLFITKKAKLIAVGSRMQPIIFTSSKPTKTRKSGDWGGIVILGNGKLNTLSGMSVAEGNFIPDLSLYGGDNTEEESSILKYVRIEFPGRKINQSKEINGLTLCGIGSKTIIENVMVSYSSDDSFEWFGGQGQYKNLVSYKSKDDDFDFTDGFNGELINILSIRHPLISDISGSYAIEIDGYNSKLGSPAKETLSKLKVKDAMIVNLATIDNISFIKSAISAKNLAQISIESSCISGYADVIKIDDSFKNKMLPIKSFITLNNNRFNVSNNLVSMGNKQLNSISLFQKNKFTKIFMNPKDIYVNPFNDEQPSFAMKQIDYSR